MDVILTTGRIDVQECDVLATGFFLDERPLRGSSGWIDWRFNGMLSRFIIENRFTGKWKETILIPSQGRVIPRMVLLLGLGKVRDYNDLRLHKLCFRLLEAVRKLNSSSICLSLPCEDNYKVKCGRLTEILIEGIADCVALSKDTYDQEWMNGLRLFLPEKEERFTELLSGLHRAQSNLKDRIQIKIYTLSRENLREVPWKESL